MFRVHRLEDAEGWGPFSVLGTWALEPITGHDYGLHLWPSVSREQWDGEPQYDWFLGCETEEQFYHWFPRNSLCKLASRGFNYVIYEVPHILRGRTQVMFDKKVAVSCHIVISANSASCRTTTAESLREFFPISASQLELPSPELLDAFTTS